MHPVLYTQMHIKMNCCCPLVAEPHNYNNILSTKSSVYWKRLFLIYHRSQEELL